MSAPIVKVYRKHPVLFWIWLIGGVVTYFVMGGDTAFAFLFFGWWLIWWLGDPESFKAYLNRKK